MAVDRLFYMEVNESEDQSWSPEPWIPPALKISENKRMGCAP